MSGETLFPDEYRADPPARRRTWVAGHPRTLPPGATPHQAPTPEPKVARRGDPATAWSARADERKLSEHRWRALDELVKAGARGLTDFELEAKTGLAQTSIGKRRGDLVSHDPPYAEMADETRLNHRKKPSQVWRVTQAGRERHRIEIERRG